MKLRLPILSVLIFLYSANIHAQSPGGVATDNTVWLKANQGVTLNASNQITNWTEYSGAAVTGDFSTHNPGAHGDNQVPPTILPAGINFNPYSVFVSTNPNCISSNNLINGNSIFASQAMTMFQVINLHQSNNTGVWCKWQTSNTAPGRLGDEVNNGSNPGQIRLDFRGSTIYSTTNVLNKHALYTGTADASNNLIIRLSGNQDNSITAFGSNNQSGTARLALGNDNEAGADPYPTSIDIAEFILFKRALTAAEINKVESYLAVKYGFTLIQTGANPNDYTASDGTVIWDNAANAPYYNNITGIGIDDYGTGSSALHQKQSLSINTDALVTMYNATYPSGTFPATNEDNDNAIGNDNMAFLLFGDDMGDTTLSACGANGAIARIGRVWKVQETNTINDVTLSINNNVIPGAQTLLVSTDPTFNTNVTVVPLINNGTVRYASYNFNNEQYFTFGTDSLSLNAVITDALCSGQNASIALNPTGGVPPYTFSWNTTPPQTTATLTGVSSGTYTVTVTQTGGCVYQQSFTVTSNPTDIEMNVNVDSSICTANNGQASIYPVGGATPYTYSMDGSDFTAANAFEGLAPGSHTVTVKDANGCLQDSTFQINVSSYSLQLEADTISAVCDKSGKGGEITVNVTKNGQMPYNYQWTPYENVNNQTLQDIPAGTYHVVVTDVNGCKGDTAITIGELPCCRMMMPNVFSPNSDGKNDIFIPKFTTDAVNYSFSIFNRWGQRIFKGEKSDMGWDGTEDGKPADPGVYYYTISYICERGNQQFEVHGDVTLIR